MGRTTQTQHIRETKTRSNRPRTRDERAKHRIPPSRRKIGCVIESSGDADNPPRVIEKLDNLDFHVTTEGWNSETRRGYPGKFETSAVPSDHEFPDNDYERIDLLSPIDAITPRNPRAVATMLVSQPVDEGKIVAVDRTIPAVADVRIAP